MQRLYSPGLTAILLLLVSPVPADQLYLRDGAILEGHILCAAGSEYAFRVKNAAGLTRVPKQAVKFALYDDPARAYRALDLDKTRRLFSHWFECGHIDPVTGFEASDCFTRYVAKRCRKPKLCDNDDCENSKECITCVKKHCIRVRDDSKPADDPFPYKCLWAEDIMHTIGSAVDCCSGDMYVEDWED